jgi:hypothetical protein
MDMTKAEWDAMLKHDDELRSQFERSRAAREPVLNAGELQVREHYERQRPTLDPATQKLWDDWFERQFDAHFKAACGPLADAICDGISDGTSEMEKELTDQIVALRAEVEQLKALQSGIRSGQVQPLKQVPDFLLRGNSKG